MQVVPTVSPPILGQTLHSNGIIFNEKGQLEPVDLLNLCLKLMLVGCFLKAEGGGPLGPAKNWQPLPENR